MTWNGNSFRFPRKEFSYLAIQSTAHDHHNMQALFRFAGPNDIGSKLAENTASRSIHNQSDKSCVALRTRLKGSLVVAEPLMELDSEYVYETHMLPYLMEAFP